MNYLSEPKGAARAYSMGAMPLPEPRGLARQYSMGAMPLPEPRGLARQYSMGAVSIPTSVEEAKSRLLSEPKAEKEEKILGLPKNVAIVGGIVLAAGAVWMLTRKKR